MTYLEKRDLVLIESLKKRKLKRIERIEKYFELRAYLDDRNNIYTLDRRYKERELKLLMFFIKGDSKRERRDARKWELILRRAEDREKVRKYYRKMKELK